MNILFYSTVVVNPEIGGAERVTDLLAHYLKSCGHSVYFVSFVTRKLSLNTDIQTFILPDSSRINSSVNISFLDHLLEKLQINILMNQYYWDDGVFLNNHKVLKSKVKIITTLHCSMDTGFNILSEVCRFEYPWNKPILCAKSIFRHIRLPYLKRRNYKDKKSKMNFMHQYTDVIVLLSPKYFDRFKELSGLYFSDKIMAIPNPLTYSNIKVKDIQQKENSILFVGRFAYPEKRVDRLLHIWQKIQNKLPDWRLDLVGDGEERENLEMLAKKLKLKNVFFHGFCSPLEYYSKAKIISLVSNYEGLSMSLLEGMQNGCIPIVFSSFEAVTDVITDGKNGYLIEPFDMDMYAEKLYKLASDPVLLEEMQPLAVQAVEQYNMEDVGRKWMDLIQSLENK